MGTLLPSLEVYLGKVDKTCSVVSKVQVTAIFLWAWLSYFQNMVGLGDYSAE